MEDVGPQSILPVLPVSNNILGVQPNRLENLDDLLAQAEHYANHSMRNLGHLPPTLFLIGSKGPVIYTPESLADESEKDDFATTARLMCIACCLMQRHRTVLGLRVNIRAFVEQQFGDVFVAGACCQKQRRLVVVGLRIDVRAFGKQQFGEVFVTVICCLMQRRQAPIRLRVDVGAFGQQ